MTTTSSTRSCPPCPKSPYLALIVDELNYMVIVHRRGNKLSFPTIECGEAPMRAQNMCACFSRRFEKMCGTKYEFLFLYSTTNECLHKDKPWPPHAMLHCISPIDPQKDEPVPPASKEYEWMSIEKVADDMNASLCLDPQISPWEFTPAESSAIKTILRGDGKVFSEEGLRPWEMPKWHNETEVEATITLEKHGYIVNGKFEQFQITPRAALLRASTNKGTVYLKASTRREVKATALVASFAPHLVRKPIAVNEEKEWMLMYDYGTPLEEELSVEEFEKFVHALGRLQLESMTHIEELKEAGIPQVSCESLICRTKEMLKDEEVRRILGTYESFECGAQDGMADVNEHSEALFKLLRSMYENKRYPISLVHGDLDIHNMAKDRNGTYIVFDWGMAKLDFPVNDIIPPSGFVDSKVDLNSEILHPYFKLFEEYASISELQWLSSCIRWPEFLAYTLQHFEYGKLRNFHPPLLKGRVQDLAKLLVSAKEKIKTVGT